MERRNFGVELRGFGVLGAQKVWSLYWTDVLNCEGLCGTKGYSDILAVLIRIMFFYLKYGFNLQAISIFIFSRVDSQESKA